MSLAEKETRSKKAARSAGEESGDEAFAYVVRSGDSLDKIAHEHGVTVRQILRWNSMRSSRIKPGKKLVLYPTIREVESRHAKSVADAKAQSQGKTKQLIYVVRKGDTISEIAQAHAVRESELRQWNSLSRRSRIYAGQELIIRKDAN